MTALRHIDLSIPTRTQDQADDAAVLMKLLCECANIRPTTDGLESVLPAVLAPTIRVQGSQEASPQVSFVTAGGPVAWQAADFQFGFDLADRGPEPLATVGKPSPLRDRDQIIEPLSMGSLFERFTGHLREVDHVGMNFGPSLVPEAEFVRFRSLLARSCALYRYPTGEEWPFIIPASEAEVEADITDFSLNRNPKFEIVYSDYLRDPVIQIDIATTLTRAEVLEKLPAPWGISLTGLEDMFRSVYVAMPWGRTRLRLDLGFRPAGENFGYWMIREGGRYRS